MRAEESGRQRRQKRQKDDLRYTMSAGLQRENSLTVCELSIWGGRPLLILKNGLHLSLSRLVLSVPHESFVTSILLALCCVLSRPCIRSLKICSLAWIGCWVYNASGDPISHADPFDSGEWWRANTIVCPLQLATLHSRPDEVYTSEQTSLFCPCQCRVKLTSKQRSAKIAHQFCVWPWRLAPTICMV